MLTSNLKIVFWNCRSIRNKIIEFNDFLSVYNVDICCLTETWLNESQTFYHPNYECIRKDRIGQNGGGVAILVKKTIKFSSIPCISTQVMENVGIAIELADNVNLNIYSVYFPGGQNNSNSRSSFKSDLRKMLNTGQNYLFCGDFNSRHRSWNCLRANSWGNILHEFTTYFPMTICFPDTPTYIPAASRVYPSTLDLALTNIPQLISNPCTLNELSSDHLPVVFNISSSAQLISDLGYNFSRANWKLYKRFVRAYYQNINFYSMNTSAEIDECIENFTFCLLEGVRQFVPMQTPHKNFVKLPSFIRELMRIRNYHRREWTRYRQISDYTIMNRYNVLIRSGISMFRNKRWNERLKTLHKASKPFWNVSKILRKKSSPCHGLLSSSGVLISDYDKANGFAESFCLNHQISDNLGIESHNIIVEEAVNQFDLMVITTPAAGLVSSSEVEGMIKTLKRRKACGLDKINNEMLKNLPENAIDYLTSIYNACLKTQYFPNVWKTAKVIPIPKPGKPLNRPASYRPISLLSSLGKVLEKLVKEKLLDFITHNNILPQEQFGFRQGHSTVHQIKRICNDIKLGFQSGQSTALVLLDIEKAFDSVWHSGLVFKLLSLQFPLHLVRMIKMFLSDRFFCVNVGNSVSDLKLIPAGVPQGSVLGPILYNIFCADIPILNPCRFAAYADDLAIYYSHELGQVLVTELQCALYNLEEYYFKWKIKLNSDKTQSIFFTRKRKICFLPDRNLRICEKDIQWLESVKYLGIFLDKKITFNRHVTYIIEKVNLYKKILYPLINRNSNLNIDNKMLIVKVIFQAIILYGCPVWGNCAKTHIKRLQIAQNKLLKMVLRLPWHFSTTRLHLISDTNPVSDCINNAIENFITKCSLSENRLISNLYS